VLDDDEKWGHVVCMFCNGRITDDEESCSLTLQASWSGGSDIYWCHGGCLEEVTHPATPLYLLSLQRDTAVYGKRVATEAGE